MERLNIYFSADTDLTEYEAINKGYRLDVYVKIDENIFNLRVYTLIRLQQDFETEWKTTKRYLAEPNLVLVRETAKEEIISTVNELYRQNYFEYIKSINNIDISKLVRIQ